jgi:hypothetical protein
MATPNQQLATRSVEDSALSTREDFSSELAPTAAAAEKQFEIQSAIIIAKRFPRDEDAAFQKLMKACGRTSFAEDAEYSFPRGDSKVNGPSVALAREAARVWTNIRYGLTIIRDDAQSRQIQGWAWDMETNTKVTAEDDFEKLIYRKPNPRKNFAGGWIKPDERDLRELTNRRGSILMRNCILQVLPKDLIEDAVDACHQTLRSNAEKDPDGARKKILVAFSELNVTAEMLATYLGHPLAQSSPSEIADLRAIYKSISDHNSKWSDYVSAADSKEANVNGHAGVEQSKSERLAEQLAQQQGSPVTQPSGESSTTTASPAPEQTQSAPTLPLETSEPRVIDGITFPANLRCTSLQDKATLDQYTLVKDECDRVGVKLATELKKVLKLDWDELNQAAAIQFLEYMKARKSKGEK